MDRCVALLVFGRGGLDVVGLGRVGFEAGVCA